MTNNPDKTFLYEVIKARKRKREVERVEAGLDVVSPDLVQRVEPLSKGKRNEKQEKKEGGRKERRTVRNDYSQNCVNTGYRPQNYIRDSSVLERFEEYPKLQTLTTLKNSLVRHRSTPPMYLHCDLRTFPLHTLKTRFDVILIDPPLEEYCHWSATPLLQTPHRPFWTWPEIGALRIEDIASTPSFIFIWVGDGVGLDKGRDLLAKWGYRRCEDICWIKTNKVHRGVNVLNGESVLNHTKEHCLMGIKGTVRRSTDSNFIHCNVDTDVVIAEEPGGGDLKKPEELYYIVEHFCLGRRRLELFGEDHNIRPGWVTLGSQISTSNFNPQRYASYFEGPGGTLLGHVDEIEMLRPKSPPLSGKKRF